jgi:hypothetical protein
MKQACFSADEGLGLGYIAVPAYEGSLAETRSLQPDQNKKRSLQFLD